jgi:hypothetical protein
MYLIISFNKTLLYYKIKKMQKFNLTNSVLFIIIVIGSMLYFQSCDNSCDSIECQNGGSCTDGACDCLAGYGGDNCETFLTCDVLSPLCPANSTCENPTGTATEAACYCNAGYEGAACNTFTRTFYTNGNTLYTPLDVCTVGGPVATGETFTYQAVKITNGANPDEFIMEGFGGFDSPMLHVKCKITGANTFIAPPQTGVATCLTVSTQPNTNGTLNRITNTIVFPYKIVYDDASIDMCTVTLTRQ